MSLFRAALLAEFHWWSSHQPWDMHEVLKRTNLYSNWVRQRTIHPINCRRNCQLIELVESLGYCFGSRTEWNSHNASHPQTTMQEQSLHTPQPRYIATWDVNTVLEYVRSQGCNLALTLRQLTLKLAMLLALANASRSSEIHALSTEHMVRSTGGVKFLLNKLTKTDRPGKPTSELCYSRFLDDPLICPVETLERYLEATKVIRVVPSKQQLFLSFVKPHNPVSTSTIARWLKTVLAEAGIERQFKAHSVRGAAVSAAFMKGMSVSDIMKMANWSSDHMFKKHYFRQVATSDSPNLFQVLHWRWLWAGWGYFERRARRTRLVLGKYPIVSAQAAAPQSCPLLWGTFCTKWVQSVEKAWVLL